MRTTLLGMIMGMSVMAASQQVGAHHSFASEFDQNKPITLKGTLTKMEWVNPHGWLYVDVKGPDGTVVNWAIEAGGPSALLRRGLRHTDFPIGVEVVVEGYLAKNGRSIANGREVKFADGRNFFLGSSLANAGGDASKP
jgi:hypothetical protein